MKSSNKKSKCKKDTFTKSSIIGQQEQTQNVFDDSYEAEGEDLSLDFSKKTPQFDQSAFIENLQKNMEKLIEKVNTLEEEI